ncbi:MAG: hypothetical protein U1C70_04195 [Sediminibacterium sp.]|uniref:hypothetical protein n=1 Tax=Sediminibacterium sp. TaxID=1917865 RepID=UPI002ABBCAA2|nr:hypothetical protein [Sediminibacterium sp.]MDZ4071009.1 hypothetical protein [Sediminibacterium sp.]
MEQFKLETMTNVEKLAKEQIRTFRLMIIALLVVLILMILGGFMIISSNKDRIYVFDGTYGVKRVERVEDKIWYFSASYVKLLLEGNKYTFDTTVTTAFNLAETGTPAQDFIKALVNNKLYETAAAENAQFTVVVDSVRVIQAHSPYIADVFMTNDRINQYGRIRKSQIFQLTLDNTPFSEWNPFGLKVHDIVLKKDEVILKMQADGTPMASE